MSETNAGAALPPDIPSSPELARQAAETPGGWAYEFDRPYREDAWVPPEAIRGAWKVDDAGRLTAEFQINPRHRPVERCRRELKPYMHAGARTHPDEWISEVDPRGEDRFPDVPPELIRGWWYVDGQGRITDEFRPNSLWVDEAAPSPAAR